VVEYSRDDLLRIVSYAFPHFLPPLMNHTSWEPLHSSSCSHFVFSHTLRPGSRFYPLLFCEASLSPYSFSTVLTGSVAIVSLNVDPVLYTSYPFILPLWIAQTHILVIRNHIFPESFLLNGFLTAECVFTTNPFSNMTDMGISRYPNGPMSPRWIKP